jgi:hypothetical protein
LQEQDGQRDLNRRPRIERQMRPLLLALLLAACGTAPEEPRNLDTLDRELAAVNTASPAADPALRSALRDQIMVDPALVQQANGDALRPPPQPQSGMIPPDRAPEQPKAAENEPLRTAPPATAGCPQCAAARRSLTLGALAEAQGGRTAGCAEAVSYSAGWANRLPAGVPLYPDARVAEAAGADRPGCALRIVSFASAAPVQRLLDWYYTRTARAGYRAQHGADGTMHTLGGTKRGAAFLLILTPRADGGTDADLMADGA